jgi:hypothetical protein
MGIKRILALSHNGYGPDMELAANTHGIDLIVGGHSHSYLGDPSNPLSQGPYPTIIKNLKGDNTLIVQVRICCLCYLPQKRVCIEWSQGQSTKKGSRFYYRHSVGEDILVTWTWCSTLRARL